MHTVKCIKTYGLIGCFYKAWNKLIKCELPKGLGYFFSRSFLRKTIIKTYDGSGQSVHPDIIEYQKKIFMAFTPYPFGIDTYENPCIAMWNNKQWTLIPGANPLIKENDFKWHLSDPCLFVYQGYLVLLYRKTEKANSKNSSLFITKSSNGFKWEQPYDLKLPLGKDYISPAIIYTQQVHLVYIDTDQERNKAMILSGNSLESLDSIEEIELQGFNNEKIWHVGVSAEENWNKKHSSNSRFDCLITTITKEGEYKLYFGNLYFCQGWILKIKSEVIPEELKKEILYKSSFAVVENKKYIFISWKDHRGRWKISKYLSE